MKSGVLLIAVFSALFIYSVIIMLSPGIRRKGKEYDERQLLARSKAYRVSFILLLLYCAVCAILEMFEIKWAYTEIMLLIGVFGSITVFAVICIFKDAYNVIFRQKYAYDDLIYFFGWGAFWLGRFIWDISHGKNIFTNGMLNAEIMDLLFSVLLLSIFLARLIMIIVKRAADDE